MSTTGELFILKADESFIDGLPGATIELYRDNPPLGGSRGPEDVPTGLSCTTGPDGQCDMLGIPFGDYWPVETRFPDGYSPAERESHLEFGTGFSSINLQVNNRPVPENIRVNDPAGDTAVGDGSHNWQFGVAIAADRKGQRLFSVFNDTPHLDDAGSVSGTGYGFSNNRGVAWTDGGELPAGNNLITGDARVEFDPRSGRFIVVTTGCSRDASNVVRCPPFIIASTFGAGQDPSFGPLIPIDPNMAPFPAFAHSVAIVGDAFPDSPFEGRIYVVWTRSNADGTSQIFLSRATFLDQWETIPVSPVGAFDFPDIAVAPDGTVHIVFSRFGSGTAATNDILHVMSTDGGATVTTPIVLVEGIAKSGTPGTCDGRPTRLLGNGIEAIDRPQIVVNPQSQQQLVVASTAQGVQPGDVSDVFFLRSNDGGATWTPPFLVPPFDGEQAGLDLVINELGMMDLAAFAIDLTAEAESVDLFLASFALVGRDLPDFVRILATQRVNSVPSGVAPQDPPSDTSGPPCQGLGSVGLHQTRSVFAAWTDGRDPGPPASNGIDPNIYFAHVQTPRIPTTTTVTVDRSRTQIEVGGELNPSLAGDALTVLLFQDDGDGFDRIGRRRVEVNARHRYSTSFDRPDAGRCRVVVKFAGSPDQQKSSARRTFAC